MPSSIPKHDVSPSAQSKATNENYHHPQSVEELTRQNVDMVVQLEEAAKAQRTTADRVADAISDFCGSMTFVWVHIAWFVIWIGLNTWLPKKDHFDPFPFTFLTLVVSLEAIFLSTFILISQNHQTRLSERRNHLDLQINLLSEQENTKMLQLLERIAQHIGIPGGGDPHVKVLEESTQPEQLVEQIESAIEETTRREKQTGTPK
jgi:uncharacterized membrane protein